MPRNNDGTDLTGNKTTEPGGDPFPPVSDGPGRGQTLHPQVDSLTLYSLECTRSNHSTTVTIRPMPRSQF